MSDVVYDGFSFEDNGCVITNIDQYTLAPRKNQLEDRVNRSGAVLVQSFYGSKPITVEGYYTGLSTADAQSMYDTLARALNRQERRLVLDHAGGTRTYTATPETPIISNPDGLNRVLFNISFIVPEGSSFSSSNTTLVDETVTTATSTIPVSVDGSVEARPFITLTFDSVTGGTGGTVTIRNSKDYVGLTFSRDFSTNDQITIDAANFQIYINGVLTEPEGRIPTWQPGDGAIYYSDTFTARSVDITGTYQERNL